MPRNLDKLPEKKYGYSIDSLTTFLLNGKVTKMDRERPGLNMREISHGYASN